MVNRFGVNRCCCGTEPGDDPWSQQCPELPDYPSSYYDPAEYTVGSLDLPGSWTIKQNNDWSTIRHSILQSALWNSDIQPPYGFPADQAGEVFTFGIQLDDGFNSILVSFSAQAEPPYSADTLGVFYGFSGYEPYKPFTWYNAGYPAWEIEITRTDRKRYSELVARWSGPINGTAVVPGGMWDTWKMCSIGGTWRALFGALDKRIECKFSQHRFSIA